MTLLLVQEEEQQEEQQEERTLDNLLSKEVLPSPHQYCIVLSICAVGKCRVFVCNGTAQLSCRRCLRGGHRRWAGFSLFHCSRMVHACELL